MQNSFSGFQILASTGLQQGEGIAPPNITSNLVAYNAIPTVSNFSNIYAHALTLPFGLTTSNANILISLGANSFPHLFGQVPNDFSSNLGTGPLMDITYSRTENWFGNSTTANVYLQVLSQAQTYAATAQTVLGSAAQTQWSGSPASSATGGFSEIGGNNVSTFSGIANVLIQLGTLMIPTDAFNGFSNADCFNRILESGNDTIGNLHLTFFGQPFVDPTTGNTWTIGSSLFQYIMSNPEGLSADNTFLITALNPLDAQLGEMANQALTQTGDLDAVVTFFNVGPNVAPSIYQWTDCLNIPLLFGPTLTSVISQALGIGNNTLSPYYFIQGLVNNIPGLSSIQSLTALGLIMSQITPLSNLDMVTSLASPITQEQFSNLQASFGPGSGTNGNPTVDDVLGATNYNEALTNTVIGLNPLMPTTTYANISSDTAKINSALITNTFPVTLSNGVSYADINSLAVGGSTLVNQNAMSLANLAPSVTNTSLFTAYNGIAETHNNSETLTTTNGQIPISVSAIVSDATSSFPKASGLVGLVLKVISQYIGISSTVMINNPPMPSLFMKVPGGLSISALGSLTSFPSALASMASAVNLDSSANEITGLSNVTNCLDLSTTTGQALSATITEAQNSQVLNNGGLPLQNFATNTTALITAATGTHTLGGGLIS